jgi:hypothetical protein
MCDQPCDRNRNDLLSHKGIKEQLNVTAKIPSKGKTYSKDHLKGGGTTYGKDIKASDKAKSKEVWVKITRQEYEGLKETIDLLSRPANARRLRSALAQAKAGKLKEREL